MLQRDNAGKINSLWKIGEDDSRMKISRGLWDWPQGCATVPSMGTRKWQFRFDSDGQTIRGEQREYSARKQQGRARNDNYRSNRQHPNFAEEQAKGQALLDAWAESLNNDKDKPRSR